MRNRLQQMLTEGRIAVQELFSSKVANGETNGRAAGVSKRDGASCVAGD